ncbi:MAG TPA: hypothetical protein PKC24_09785 [Cyclobacteriaceae bacterium]|nr:hypothetical protein [Cyclobacteriaceae bacterium]
MDDCQKQLVEQWANLEDILLNIKQQQDIVISDLKTEVNYLREKLDSQAIMLNDAFTHIKKIEAAMLNADETERIP